MLCGCTPDLMWITPGIKRLCHATLVQVHFYHSIIYACQKYLSNTLQNVFVKFKFNHCIPVLFSGVSSGGHSPAENEFNDTIMVLHEQAATGDIREPVDSVLVGWTERKTGRTPLHTLLSHQHKNLKDEKIITSVNNLCKVGADINARDNGTPFNLSKIFR